MNPNPNTKLSMLVQIPYTQKWSGTCPVCHGMVDLDAEEAHLWWHSQQPKPQSYETRPIKIGRHHI